MDWLNSANAIASLVLAVFGIGGYIYGIATYLKKKASQPQQSSPTPSTSSQTSSIPRKPISWLGWIELFTQGFVNTANFILGLFPFEGFEMANRKKVQGICPYCGKQALLTRDHVIPQCLFTNGVPGNSPKVYACSPCNNILKSRQDTYFRDFLILDIEGSEHPVAKQLFPKLARSIVRNQSEFARHARNAQPMQRFTPEGLFAGIVYGAEIPNHALADGVTMMTRGLYYYYTKQFLPQNIDIQAHRQ
jgi:hypothetical protein